MDQIITEQTKKTTPWISALYSLSAALAGAGGLIWQGAKMLEKVKENKDIPNAELTRVFWDYSWVIIAVVTTSIIATIINFVCVAKGGRKWTLIPSIIGALIGIGIIFLYVKAYMIEVGNS